MSNQSEFKTFGEDLPTEKCLLEFLPLVEDDEPVQGLFDPELKMVFWKGQPHQPLKYRVLTTQHFLTEQDFANNPELVGKGLKVGDEIGLPIFPDAENKALSEQFDGPESEDGAGSAANFEKVDGVVGMFLPDSKNAAPFPGVNVYVPNGPKPELTPSDVASETVTEPATNKPDGDQEQPV